MSVLALHRVADADGVELYEAALRADGPATLVIGGVVPPYEVLLDEQPVRSGRSMFERHELELEPGEHVLRIRCRPLGELLSTVPTRPRARWRTPFVDEPRLRWVRTSLLGHCPSLLTGAAPSGPWRPVQLIGGPRVAELGVRTEVAGETGVLTLTARTRGLPDEARVEAELTGGDGVVTAALNANGQARLEIPGVRRWWPHTHGEPALYDLRLRHDGAALPLPTDGTTVPDRYRVGFRTLGNGDAVARPDVRENSIDLHLNGERVFVRGAVWTPGDLAALDEARRLGLNMVRVPGWATYESDAFHERCAELGLLVWQDLMFANLDVPVAEPELRAAVGSEIAAQVARLRRQPAAVVLCGSSDTEQQATMSGLAADDPAVTELSSALGELVARAEVDLLWVPSAPTGGDLPFRPGQGVATYFGVGAYRRPLGDVRTSGVRFAAECLAFANPAEEPSGGPVPRDAGADWDFADVREHYLRSAYGDEPSDSERARVGGEMMAEVFGFWRRSDSGCGGGLVLWLRDPVAGDGWGLLDHQGRPKPAAAALAPVLAPVALWLSGEGLGGVDAHLANDTAAAVRGRLEVALTRADGSVVIDGSREIELPARGHLRMGVEELLGRFVDASYAYRFGPQAHEQVVARLTPDRGEALVAAWRVAPPHVIAVPALGCCPSPLAEEPREHV